jgi:lipid-A-disaccharide synthase-like uncharacterized protein
MFIVTTFMIFTQCLYYEQRRSRKAATLMAGSLMLLIGSLQVAIVFAIRPTMNERATTFFGVFAAILIATGLVPQYVEIIKRKEVIGISLVFLTVDILGGVFSDLSLVFRDKFDIVAAMSYNLVIVSYALYLVYDSHHATPGNGWHHYNLCDHPQSSCRKTPT